MLMKRIDAIDDLMLAYKVHQTDIHNLNLIGFYHYSQGHFSQALEFFVQCLSISNNHHRSTMLGKAKCLVQLNRFSEAIPYFVSICNKSEPKPHLEAHIFYGYACLQEAKIHQDSNLKFEREKSLKLLHECKIQFKIALNQIFGYNVHLYFVLWNYADCMRMLGFQQKAWVALRGIPDLEIENNSEACLIKNLLEQGDDGNFKNKVKKWNFGNGMSIYIGENSSVDFENNMQNSLFNFMQEQEQVDEIQKKEKYESKSEEKQEIENREKDESKREEKHEISSNLKEEAEPMEVKNNNNDNQFNSESSSNQRNLIPIQLLDAIESSKISIEILLLEKSELDLIRSKWKTLFPNDKPLYFRKGVDMSYFLKSKIGSTFC